MHNLSQRNRQDTRNSPVTYSWRKTKAFYDLRAGDETQQRDGLGRRSLFSSSNFVCAFIITVVIVIAQLFIVHHYVSSSSRNGRLFSSKGVNSEADLLTESSWFCHSFPHLNRIARLAWESHVELVIVDPDLLELLLNGDGSESSSDAVRRLEFSYGGKTSQEASHKTVIHLAVVNETSGGQPNLSLFYNALKKHYHLLKYNDASETMPAEVYKRKSHLFDDMQADAIQESKRLHPRADVDPEDLEISKIYTEFLAHLFVLNSSSPAGSADKWSGRLSSECPSPSSVGDNPEPFVVIHLFVLYNYEFQPDSKWIQSNLMMDEADRLKLLGYGVHSIDFKVPLNHYYVHEKRKTSYLFESGPKPLKPDRPLNRVRVLEPDRMLDYANNTYLHCKPTAFNIGALIDGQQRQMSAYLKKLNAAKPLKPSVYRTKLIDQLSVAVQFMNVFSRSYGNFSFWLTGSTLLAYHKFCELIAVSPPGSRTRLGQTTEDDELLLLSVTDYEEAVLNDKTMLEFELGLFESELNSTMLSDLSEANMIGVTMISDWREPSRNSLVSFHVKDCPNLIFNLHFYKLESDFYQRYYVTKDNMIYNHKFRRRKSTKKGESQGRSRLTAFLDPSALIGHHVFSTKNLELCWTRLDHMEPFRVPCDVHEHLRKIYVI